MLEARLEAVFCRFGIVSRFEARVCGGGFAVLADVLADAEAGFGVLLENLPIVSLFLRRSSSCLLACASKPFCCFRVSAFNVAQVARFRATSAMVPADRMRNGF